MESMNNKDFQQTCEGKISCPFAETEAQFHLNNLIESYPVNKWLR